MLGRRLTTLKRHYTVKEVKHYFSEIDLSEFTITDHEELTQVMFDVENIHNDFNSCLVYWSSPLCFIYTLQNHDVDQQLTLHTIIKFYILDHPFEYDEELEYISSICKQGEVTEQLELLREMFTLVWYFDMKEEYESKETLVDQLRLFISKNITPQHVPTILNELKKNIDNELLSWFPIHPKNKEDFLSIIDL